MDAQAQKNAVSKAETHARSVSFLIALALLLTLFVVLVNLGLYDTLAAKGQLRADQVLAWFVMVGGAMFAWKMAVQELLVFLIDLRQIR